MLDLNMLFQHVVNCAGLAIFELFVGLICVCVLAMFIVGGIAAASWVRPSDSDDTSMADAAGNDPANFVFMMPMY